VTGAQVQQAITDPTRHVTSASVWMTLLGITQLVAAGCVLMGLIQSRSDSPSPGNSTAVGLMWSTEILEVLAGILLLVCAAKIKKGRKWAAVTGMVTIGCVMCFYVFAIIAFAMSSAKNGQGITSGLMLYCAGIVVACIVTLLYLIRSFDGLRIINGTEPKGFDVLDVHSPKSKS